MAAGRAGRSGRARPCRAGRRRPCRPRANTSSRNALVCSDLLGRARSTSTAARAARAGDASAASGRALGVAAGVAGDSRAQGYRSRNVSTDPLDDVTESRPAPVASRINVADMFAAMADQTHVALGAGRLLDPRPVARVDRADRARQDAGARRRAAPARSRDRAPPDRRARDAREKTKGNLDEAEQKLLASLVYDLRVAYVDAQKAPARRDAARASRRSRRRSRCSARLPRARAARSTPRRAPARRRVAPRRRRPRILYPSAPGSFVDLVAGARHGVVAIRAGAPVKSGPAAMFPGAPETTADVALGTGFLDRGATASTCSPTITSPPASTELHVVLPDRTEVPAKLVGRDTAARSRAALDRRAAARSRCRSATPTTSQVGEWLVVLGNPFGDEVTASAGIVSATGREGAGSLVRRPRDGLPHVHPDRRAHPPRQLRRPGARHRRSGRRRRGRDRRSPRRAVVRDPDQPRASEVVDALRDYGQVARSWLGVLVQPVTAELAQTLGLAEASRRARHRGQGRLARRARRPPRRRRHPQVGRPRRRSPLAAVDRRADAAPASRSASASGATAAEIAITVVTEKMPE